MCVIREIVSYQSKLGKRQGGAIRQKNSRPVIMLRAAADFSGLDVQIFYNLGSYESPESPL